MRLYVDNAKPTLGSSGPFRGFWTRPRTPKTTTLLLLFRSDPPLRGGAKTQLRPRPATLLAAKATAATAQPRDGQPFAGRSTAPPAADRREDDLAMANPVLDGSTAPPATDRRESDLTAVSPALDGCTAPSPRLRGDPAITGRKTHPGGRPEWPAGAAPSQCARRRPPPHDRKALPRPPSSAPAALSEQRRPHLFPHTPQDGHGATS